MGYAIGIVLLIVFYFLFRKGSLLNEIIHLPFYHYQLHKNLEAPLKYEKIKYGSHPRQYFIKFSPTKSLPSPLPIVVFFHGGGWRFGKPEMFEINAQFFCRLGYEVYMPSYRRIPKYSYPDIREDLNTLVPKIISAAKLEGDKHQIIVAGMSAGANLSALLVYDKAALKSIGLTQDIFAGLLCLGAPLDLEAMAVSPIVYAYAGKRGSQKFKSASPISHLDTTEKLPVLIVQGTKDGMVNYKSAYNFYLALRERQKGHLQFMRLEGKGHLDTGAWNFGENEISKVIKEWLTGLKA